MTLTPSPSGSSTRREVLSILREWLEEANDLAYHFGGTYGTVLAEALERLEDRTIERAKEGDGTDPGRGADLAPG